jgi:heme exporter protein C
MTEGASRSRGLEVLALCAWGATALALYFVFFVAREADRSMGGQLQRAFYFHVPSAWVAYLAFAIVFVSSIAYLRTGTRRWDLVAHASAEIGVLFCSLVLITGPIWARPVWGTWWQWDARLTSTLVLWLTYVGYLLLRGLATDPSRIGRLAAVVGVAGFANVPIVHFSVYWWRTFHPQGPTVANPTQSSGLGAGELLAFFTALIALTLLYAWLLALRTRLGVLQERLTELEMMRSLDDKVTAPT